MEIGSASSEPAAKTPGVAGAGDAREQAQETEETTPRMAYLAALYADALRYIYLTEEDLVEEYWQARKFHKYD